MDDGVLQECHTGDVVMEKEVDNCMAVWKDTIETGGTIIARRRAQYYVMQCVFKLLFTILDTQRLNAERLDRRTVGNMIVGKSE